MLASLGKDPTDDYLEAMMNEAPGPINFTMFLTLFGERLQAGLISILINIFDPMFEGPSSSTTFLNPFRETTISWVVCILTCAYNDNPYLDNCRAPTPRT